MKHKLKKIILIILIIINCATIFCLSSEQGEKSGNTSKIVVGFISNMIPSIRNMEESKKIEFQENVMQPIVRKLAHFSIYTILGFLTMNFALTCKISRAQKYLYTLLFGIIYACTDEIHQLFVADRSGQIADVVIDSLGVLTGMSIAIIIVVIFTKLSKMLKSKKSLT